MAGGRGFPGALSMLAGIALVGSMLALVPSHSLAEAIYGMPSEAGAEQQDEPIYLNSDQKLGISESDTDGYPVVLASEDEAGLELEDELDADDRSLMSSEGSEGEANGGSVGLQAQGGSPVHKMGAAFLAQDGGLLWACREYTGDGSSAEAVIYGATQEQYGPLTELNVPRTVKKGTKNLIVVGVICEDEAESTYEEFSVDERWTGHFAAPGSGYFGDNNQIEAIVLPETVRFIGAGAFLNYRKLSVVRFNGETKLESIGEMAFYGCSSLKDFVHSDALSDIGIPSSVTRIGADAFTECLSIERIAFPVGVDTDGSPIGYNDSLLSIENAPGTISLSSNVEHITFQQGTKTVSIRGETPVKLTEVTIPDDAEYVDGFDECPALRAVRLPESVTEIGSFRNCTSLEYINLPANLSTRRLDFYGCKNLHIAVTQSSDDYLLDQQYARSGITSVNLPSTLTYMTSYICFSGCKDLQSINVAPGGDFCSIDGVFFYRKSNPTSMYDESLFKYPAAKNDSSYTIPSWVKTIYPLAFEDCRLSEIHIPVTVECLDQMDNATLQHQNADWDGTEIWYGPFDRMDSNPTIYYVKNSHADSDIHSSWRPLRGNFKEEPGPPVRVKYQLNGGTNAADNPTTIAGGTSVTLKNPTRNGYRFDGWYNGDSKLADGVLTPKGDELYEGVVVEAHWSGGKPFFLDAKPSDTKNHGIEVEWMGISGISTGWQVKGGREYRGLQGVARCDFAAFMYRFADISDNGKRDDSIKLTDAEVESTLASVSDCTMLTPHAVEIAWLINVGISKGWTNSDGETVCFKPLSKVARQDMAAFLYRFADLNDNNSQDSSLKKGSRSVLFADVEHGDDGNHASEVEWLASVGISKGWPLSGSYKYEFRGTKTVARQDMAAFMYRLNGYLG